MTTLCKKGKKSQKDEPIDDTCTIFYRSGETYEITINPSDKYQFKGKPSRTSEFIHSIVKKLYNTLAESCDYSLYVEYSEPRHSNGKLGTYPRLHLHGTIKINDTITFLETTLVRLMEWADYQVNKYRPEYWQRYVSKQMDEWNDFYKRNKLIPRCINEKLTTVQKKPKKVIFNDNCFAVVDTTEELSGSSLDQ